VRSVQRGPAIGLVAQLGLLGLLTRTLGLGAPGWWAGVACGLGINLALARGLTASGALGLGPADRVTLTRATVVGGVTALTADALWGASPPHARTVLVGLTVVALVLDGVDGWVARRTSTASALGARFDLEVDAFLILVLSVLVAPTSGTWVLLIGVARYLFVVAGWAMPWLRITLLPRYWRKVVAATQGVVLTATAAQVGPPWVTRVALAAALGLLTESFGRDLWWLWRSHDLAARRLPERFGPGDAVVTATAEASDA
jgi:phosphatidylglycerophosphate synthase